MGPPRMRGVYRIAPAPTKRALLSSARCASESSAPACRGFSPAVAAAAGQRVLALALRVYRAESDTSGTGTPMTLRTMAGRRATRFICAALLAVVAAGARAQAPAEPADLIVTHA